MTYDTWKTTEPEEYHPGPSKEQIAESIATREREIDWLVGRLANLVLKDDDREQTEDLVFELRDEVTTLRKALENAA